MFFSGISINLAATCTKRRRKELSLNMKTFETFFFFIRKGRQILFFFPAICTLKLENVGYKFFKYVMFNFSSQPYAACIKGNT